MMPARAALTLAALCATAAPTLAQPREVTATLTYRERIALPPDAVARLEVLAAGRVAARAEVALRGRQVPVPMRVTFDPARLPQDVAVSLRGTLGADGMRWTGTAPLPHAAGGGPADAGTMVLTRTAAPAAVAWQARGQEPGWRAVLDETRLVLEIDNGATRITLPRPERQERDGVALLAMRTEAHDIALEIAPGICRDPMSGVPHPERVTLRLDGRVLHGCGGDPVALLMGGAWTIASIGGKPPSGERPATIAFDAEGRVHGQAPCNTFFGGYSIGEGIRFTPLGSTMRMCDPVAMEREAALYAVLDGTVPFDIGADGALTIGSGARAMVARR